MAEHIIDALIVTFGLDKKGYDDGAREVIDGNKKLKDQSKQTFDTMENAGKKTGEAIKSVSREVIGLGLAFMGARSITGFLSNLASGAASADRFGQTLGMSIEKVWAWRQAMKSMGGDYNQADQALQVIQNAKTGFRMGTLSGDTMGVLGRLGVTGSDLKGSDAGSILSKLAGASNRMDPQMYAALLQQVGLPASTIYFLQQGKDSVDKLLKQYEGSAKQEESLAKSTEDLQKSMAELDTQVQQLLIPVLNQIVPLLTQLVTILGGHVDNPVASAGPVPGTSTPFGIPDPAGLYTMVHLGPHGAEDQVYSYLRQRGLVSDQAIGITAALFAESGLDPTARNSKSGAYGISQVLSKDRRANFKRITGHDSNHSSLKDQLDFLWWELNGGDKGGKSVLSEKGIGTAQAMIMKFLRPAPGWETTRDLKAAAIFLREHRYGGQVHIHGGIHIKSATDTPHAHAQAVKRALDRRHSVAQADPMVRP